MRVLILVAGAVALAACSNNDQHDNTANVDENLTAENIVSNDVTAIDAVTGDDSNMAAAAEVNDIAPINSAEINNMPEIAKSSGPKPETQDASSNSKPKPKPTAPAKPATATTAPSTSNATE